MGGCRNSQGTRQHGFQVRSALHLYTSKGVMWVLPFGGGGNPRLQTHLRQPSGSRHRARAPVRSMGGWRCNDCLRNRRSLHVTDGGDAAWAGRVPLQAGGPQRQEQLPPQLYRVGSEAPTRQAMIWLSTPSAASRMILAPSITRYGRLLALAPTPQGGALLIRKKNRFSSSALARHDIRRPRISTAIYDAW